MEMTKKKMVLEHLVVGRLKNQKFNQVWCCFEFKDTGLHMLELHEFFDLQLDILERKF